MCCRDEKFQWLLRMSDHRMSFAEITAERRTDTMFRARAQREHHKTYSLMEDLHIDMIIQFPTFTTIGEGIHTRQVIEFNIV